MKISDERLAELCCALSQPPDWCHALSHHPNWYSDLLHVALEAQSLRAEVTKLRADAERYRKILSLAMRGDLSAFVDIGSLDHMHDEARITAAIDAARGAT